jgi:hypothetical protein
MTLVKRMLRALLLFLAVVLIVIQFFHPKGNVSNDESQSIILQFPVPDSVQKILLTSCSDCHSNHTIYPWYTYVQPIGFWLNHHIKDGKEELNFSEFSSYSPRRKYRKFTEIKEQLEKNEMPLEAYTFIHRDAELNDRQKEQVIGWTLAMKDTLEHHYPMDSLQRKESQNKRPE